MTETIEKFAYKLYSYDNEDNSNLVTSIDNITASSFISLIQKDNTAPLIREGSSNAMALYIAKMQLHCEYLEAIRSRDAERMNVLLFGLHKSIKRAASCYRDIKTIREHLTGSGQAAMIKSLCSKLNIVSGGSVDESEALAITEFEALINKIRGDMSEYNSYLISIRSGQAKTTVYDFKELLTVINRYEKEFFNITTGSLGVFVDKYTAALTQDMKRKRKLISLGMVEEYLETQPDGNIRA